MQSYDVYGFTQTHTRQQPSATATHCSLAEVLAWSQENRDII